MSTFLILLGEFFFLLSIVCFLTALRIYFNGNEEKFDPKQYMVFNKKTGKFETK